MKYVKRQVLDRFGGMYRSESHTPWCWSAPQGDSYCSAFNSSFVILSAAFVTAEREALNMPLRDPNQSWASSLWDHSDTYTRPETRSKHWQLEFSLYTLSRSKMHRNTSRQVAFVWQPAYNQDNLSQVTYIYIAIHINKQENNSVNVANFINCKSSSREENSVIIQLKFNVDSIQFNNSVIVANLVSLSGSIQFTFWRLINFKFIMEVVNLPTI